MDMLFPEGLDSHVLNELETYVRSAFDKPNESLIQGARAHIARTRDEYKRNRLVDVSLAEALLKAIEALFASWEKVPAHVRPWCRGMVLFFVSKNKGENHDLLSCVGFDDDAAVINACLRMAGREDLVVKLEASDDGR